MIKKISNVALNTLIIILLILVISNLYLNYQYRNNPNQIPKIAGFTTLEVLSGSMLPKYEVGDHLLIKETSVNNLKKGDVITFKNSKEVVITHRINKLINKNNEVYIQTKGDNNNTVDKELLTQDNIIGKVLFNFVLLKFIDQMTSQPFLLLGIVLFIIALMLIKELYKEKVATE